jgi:hypothetical protein
MRLRGGSRRRLALLVGLCVLLIPALDFLYLTFGPISGEALNYSVTRQVGGSVALGVPECRDRQDVWVCEVPDASNSGSATYRVRRDGRCWTAQKLAADEEIPLPPRASGCLSFRDQLRLFDRI